MSDNFINEDQVDIYTKFLNEHGKAINDECENNYDLDID